MILEIEGGRIIQDNSHTIMKPVIKICSNILRFRVLLLLLFSVSFTLGYVHPTIKKQTRTLKVPKSRVVAIEEEEAGNNQVWVPPTQNIEQLRGNIFCINNPEDLLDFISEDERLCVGETCVSFIQSVFLVLFYSQLLAYNLQLKSTQTGAERAKLLTHDIEN